MCNSYFLLLKHRNCKIFSTKYIINKLVQFTMENYLDNIISKLRIDAMY